MAVKILVLSAYTAASHQYWLDGLCQQFPDFEWTILRLPPRYFNWRIRGNSLTWGFTEQEKLSRHYDSVLATSMVDLSALRGFAPKLCQARTLVYFHENQFAYPHSLQQRRKTLQAVEPQLVNLYTALCADTVVFNSKFNRNTFMDGVEGLLNKLPDGIPADIVERLNARSQVLPVPIIPTPLMNEPDCGLGKQRITLNAEEKLHIIWNHRWEYDKGPDRLLQCLKSLSPRLPLTVHVVGQQFRQTPAEFAGIRELLARNDWLGNWGWVDNRTEYLQLLAQCHVVLSTALHDFQGLAVLEAYAYGCLPVVPKRLAYPEFIPDAYCYAADINNIASEAFNAAQMIENIVAQARQGITLQAPLRPLLWTQLAERYRRFLR